MATLNSLGSKKRKILAPLWKAELLKEQAGLCIWCGTAMITDDKASPDYATFEHKKRKREGGSDRKYNLALAHARCNASRD